MSLGRLSELSHLSGHLRLRAGVSRPRIAFATATVSPTFVQLMLCDPLRGSTLSLCAAQLGCMTGIEPAYLLRAAANVGIRHRTPCNIRSPGRVRTSCPSSVTRPCSQLNYTRTPVRLHTGQLERSSSITRSRHAATTHQRTECAAVAFCPTRAATILRSSRFPD